jgi:hypothetical protein
MTNLVEIIEDEILFLQDMINEIEQGGWSRQGLDRMKRRIVYLKSKLYDNKQEEIVDDSRRWV